MQCLQQYVFCLQCLHLTKAPMSASAAANHPADLLQIISAAEVEPNRVPLQLPSACCSMSPALLFFVQLQIIDVIDCTGSGDIDTSTVTKADEEGFITGGSGRRLKLNPSWQNPTGEWHVGCRRLFDLFPKTLQVSDLSGTCLPVSDMSVTCLCGSRPQHQLVDVNLQLLIGTFNQLGPVDGHDGPAVVSTNCRLCMQSKKGSTATW
jgi:hypothetical protein